MKKIAVLTSGGDAPGMNAAIRAIVRSGIYYDMEVYGVYRGYRGLIADDYTPLEMRSVSDIIQRGGTMLMTARCEEFKTAQGQIAAIENIRRQNISGVIVLGGDGSFLGAKALTDRGINAVGVPCTIDNDIAYTDYSIGFDTACNTALDAINKVRDTMNSHERISIIEVMGRNCGDIALYSGLGGGAEAIIVPEFKTDYDAVCNRLMLSRETGKRSGIVVMAEGAGKAEDVAKEIEQRTGYTVRATVLGHIQRGGSPTLNDRLLGTRMGVHAVELLRQNIGGRVVGINHNNIYDMDITEALKMKKTLDPNMFKTSAIVSR